jgi:hypothetical protein
MLMWRFLLGMYVLCRASMVLLPAEFLLSWDPSEKIIASDFELDGAKRDCASTDTLEYLFLRLA